MSADETTARSLDRVVVTGANGFVGRNLCAALSAGGHDVRAVVRRRDAAVPDGTEKIAIGELDASPNWHTALRGVDTVVHCAGVAHVRFADEDTARERFDRINRHATLELADAALRAGARRFVFLSSIGVYGRLGSAQAAVETMRCTPVEPYAVSKLAAESELAALVEGSWMELVVIRPPMIYGPDCPGNFAKLVKLVSTSLPAPLGSIDGRRNLLAIDNLADFVVLVCGREKGAGGVFNVADSDEVTVPDVVRAIAAGLERPARLLSVPPVLLRTVLAAFGRRALVDKLTESVRVDSYLAREHFGWQPAVSSLVGMEEAAESFRAGSRS